MCNPACLNGGACVPSTSTANRCQCPVFSSFSFFGSISITQLWTGNVCQTGALPVSLFCHSPAVCRAGCDQGTCLNAPRTCSCNSGWSSGTSGLCDVGKAPPRVNCLFPSHLRARMPHGHLLSKSRDMHMQFWLVGELVRPR